MPAFQFKKMIGLPRDVKVFLDLKVGATRGEIPDGEQKQQARKRRATRRTIEEQRQLLAEKERQITRLRMQIAAGRTSGTSPGESRSGEYGNLPDFLIIGAQKCGTTFLYYLLNQHPHVEPATKKEINYFDIHYDKGQDWYRSHFPLPIRGDRRTISGESSPYYLYHPHAPRRAAEVVPGAGLIALLRNPVDRAYSDYQHRSREGREPLSFEQAIEAEEARLAGERRKLLEDEGYVSPDHRKFSYLSRGIYVDQIRSWHEHFEEDRLLILQSERFFDDPAGVLRQTLEFLDLRDQLPEEALASNDEHTRHEGSYETINPATRRRLEEFFEPHNERLYEYLGTDFGW